MSAAALKPYITCMHYIGTMYMYQVLSYKFLENNEYFSWIWNNEGVKNCEAMPYESRLFENDMIIRI